jgi:ABC-2 type transport system permease protein
MLDDLRKVPVFLRRDISILYSYKSALIMSIIGTVLNIFNFVLFGWMFKVTTIDTLTPYGGDFISYILVGSIGWAVLWNIGSATSSSLRGEMIAGSLESLLLYTNVSTFVIASTIYGCFFGLISTTVILLVGFLAFGVTIFVTLNLYTIIVFVLSVLLMMGFGMIFGGLTLWIKNIGDAVPLVQSIVVFFSGVYFPISILPDFLQPVARYIPFYYVIEGLRKSLLPAPNAEMIEYVVILLIFSIAFVLTGLYAMRRGLEKAKKDGTLAFF